MFRFIFYVTRNVCKILVWKKYAADLELSLDE